MRHCLLISMLLLSGCATGINPAYYNSDPASPEAFTQCHGYSCTHKTRTGFTAAEWKDVGAIFRKPPKNAAQEREKIASAIAMMEDRIGRRTGTAEDAGAAVSSKTSDLQLDCIDETVNTMTYLGFLQDARWLKFHRLAPATHRGYFIDGSWPHNTAVIEEIGSGDLYVVDSFYRANGGEPYILPREKWLAGWKPPGATQ